MATTTAPQPRVRRFPPRAENFLAYIQEAILYNLEMGQASIVIEMPGPVEIAFMIVNETQTIAVQDYADGTVYVPVQ